MVASTFWRWRWRAISVASPNQLGTEGTAWGEAWILTGEYVILFMGPPYRKNECFLPFVRRHIFIHARYFSATRCAIRGPLTGKAGLWRCGICASRESSARAVSAMEA